MPKRKREKVEKLSDSDSRWVEEFAHISTANKEIFESQSDRACVLVSAAVMDRGMDMILRHFFMQQTHSKATEDELNFLLKPPRGPLMSAGVRVRLAYLLGLIDKEEEDAVKAVIDRRNGFAHLTKPAPITESDITKVLDLLPAAFRPVMDRTQVPVDGLPDSPRIRFARLCLGFATMFIMRADRICSDDAPGDDQIPDSD